MHTVSKICGYLLIFPALCLANTLNIPIHLISTNGIEQKIGFISVQDTQYGLLITPKLTNLSHGMHGLHIHEYPSCDAIVKNGKAIAGLAAGGHFDPYKTNSHKGPYQHGHLGDLPPVFVDAHGSASIPVLAPRLRTTDLHGHSIILHSGSDNFSDKPQKLGGGGSRIACGIIK